MRCVGRGIVRLSAPNDLCITVQELKSNVSMVDTMELDFNIRNLLLAAQDYVENASNSFLTPVTVTETWQGFPGSLSPFELSCEPVRSLTSLTYIDINGVSQTLTNLQTILNAPRPLIYPPTATIWPPAMAGNFAPITIVYEAGPATVAGARSTLRAAVLALASQNFEFGSGQTKQGPLRVSPMVESLISAGMKRGI